MTIWKIVLNAEAPITGVRTVLKSRKRPKTKQRHQLQGNAFVDVVARGGEEWIRVYRCVCAHVRRGRAERDWIDKGSRARADASKKVSSLLAELRKQDSMINSDWSDSEDEPSDTQAAGASETRSKAGPSRSVCQCLIDLVDSLLALAEVSDRPPGALAPKLTLHLTRISLDDQDLDERIPRTFELIRAKGVRVVFGDLSNIPLQSLPRPVQPTSLRPSRRICLDPTALMALCSDILHHPLPTSRQEAMKRFFRPKEALGDDPSGRRANGPGRGGERHGATQSDYVADDSEGDEWRGQSQNSRELVKDLLEEMKAPLVEEVRDLLESTLQEGEQVEWWTSKEAAVYLSEALVGDVLVGEGMEQRRMRRMMGQEPGDFWEGSRYAGQEGVLRDFRVRILDDGDGARGSGTNPTNPPTGFHRSLAHVARSCLSDYNAHLALPTAKYRSRLPNFLKPQRIPVPNVAQLSLPFPIVSLRTLARGAEEGMTTLMFGNVVLRDLFGQTRWKPHGWCQGSYELERAAMESGEAVIAAVWMLPYRSLGEGKRIKFASGDYSYPNWGGADVQ